MKKKGAKDTGKLTPEAQLQEKPSDFLIVGIGASAGGIQALQEFFRQVPEHSGMAYVVILHLSPNHDSQLAAILQRETSMPVTQITEKTFIKPDQVYVIAPDRHLTMVDGYIAVTNNVHVEERRAPVDIFFRTLADEHGPRAVSVILSGTGANGSMGLKRIKERGGATFVQNPREAEFSEMPRNAIATELVDEVLNVADIPAKIVAYRNSTGKVLITVEAEERSEDQKQALRDIFTLLRHRTGHDFSNYKRPTLLRRIERRISVRDLPDLPAYAKFLHENGDEPVALLKDLLISVTNFFRDKKAFDAVEEEIIPLLLNGKSAESQLRIWVAGCATGEEAYSFAMLCLERTIGSLEAPKIQIFATDIDEAAIAHAREGFYTINDLADVSQERLQRFFNKEADGYRIRREVRETVMFATHNFLKDPPFSHLDLVSCRNVMIYLNRTAQERVVETFHFALKPGCFLFLGNSESVDGASDLYAAYNREFHIFQSRQVSPRTYPVPESTPPLYFDKFKKDLPPREQENKILERISFGDLHQQLLEEYAPPSLVVNEEYDILHLTERAGKYLQIGGGELSHNLLKLVIPELRLELRSALYQAVQRQSAVEARGLKITIGDRTETINVQVRPVLRSGDAAKGFILVVFEPTADDSAKEVVLSSDEPVARQLEEELIKVKAHLRASNEQHDFQAEEMKASNEELQAMNEELRSAAEELETSKEELQSINEEMRTVNQELKVKIEETSIASNNLQNLINSTNIGTIFLDRSFRVVLFTPAIREIFNLRTADYGRPLSDITGSLEFENVLRNAENVLDKLVEFESEVTTKSGGVYLMRITPYRTDEDRIKGVVITFVDITQRRTTEQALRESEEKYRTLFNSMDECYILCDIIFDERGQPIDILYLDANPAAVKMTGTELVGKSIHQVDPNFERHWFETFGRVAKTGIGERHELSASPQGLWFNFYVFKVGGPNENKVAAVYEDITDRRRAEDKQVFLLTLSDALRPLADPVVVQQTAMRILGEKLRVNRAFYGDLQDDDDTLIIGPGYVSEVMPLDGHVSFKEFDSHLVSDYRQGKTVISNDVYDDIGSSAQSRAAFDAVQVRAAIGVPLVKNGKVRAILSLHQKTPRRWTPDEVALLQETAERTWSAVERARAEEALRISEERQAFLLNLSDTLRPLGDASAIERQACQELGDKLRADHTYYAEIDLANDFGIIRHDHARNGESPFVKEYQVANLGFIIPLYEKGEPIVVDDIYTSPLIPHTERALRAKAHIAWIAVPVVKDGLLVGVFCVTMRSARAWKKYEVELTAETGERVWAAIERAKTEAALRESEARQKFLLLLSDTLRPLNDEASIFKTASQLFGKYLGANRAFFGELFPGQDLAVMLPDYFRDDLPSLAGSFKLSEFKETVNALEADGKWVINDVANSTLLSEQTRTAYLKLGYRSFFSVALSEGDRLLNLSAVSSEVRIWTNEDVRLAREVAERTWNIADRTRAEEALRQFNNTLEQQVAERTAELSENRNRLQSVLDTTLVQMSILQAVRDEQGVIQDLEIKLVNKELEKETGRTDLVGKRYAEEYPGIRQTPLFDLIVKTIETGQPQLTEYYYPYDGFDKWFSCMFVKYNDGVVATNLDITARKQAEDERFKNYLLLQQSEDLAQLGSWDYDLLTGTFTWSDGMYRLFNLQKGIEVRPEVYLQYATPECQETAARIVDLIRQGSSEFEETINILVGDVVKVLRLKANVIKNAEESPVRVLGVDMDVTATREAEEKLQQLKAEQQLEIFRVTLRTLEEERRRISESLHNGLGQILFGIKMSISHLTVKFATENPVEFESSKRYTVELLSEAIHDSRRISHELMPAILEEFGLKAAVKDICNQMQDGVKFHCSVEVENGQIDKYMQLAVFRTLQELMLNIVKHAQASKAEAKVRVGNGYILLQVSDNGRGLDSYKQKKDGIGLASIRSKVGLLNGTMDIQSAPGKGTNIIIRLPYTIQNN